MVPLIAAGIAAAGAYANYANTQDKIKANNDLYNTLSAEAEKVQGQNAADIAAYKNLIDSQYGGDAAKYSQALEAFMNSPVYQNEGFSYTGDVNQFLDPAREQRVAAAMEAINNAAASGGSRFSSDYINRVAGKQQALASEEWEKAYNRLVQDRQQQLTEYNANSQNNWNNYNAQTQKQQYGINQYGQAKNALMQGYGEAMSAGVQNRTAGLQSQANVIAGMANNNNQDQSFLGQLVGPAASFLSSYYAGAGSA